MDSFKIGLIDLFKEEEDANYKTSALKGNRSLKTAVF